MRSVVLHPKHILQRDIYWQTLCFLSVGTGGCKAVSYTHLVAVLGGDIKEYQVLLDPARMKHYNVTLAEVMNVTRNMNPVSYTHLLQVVFLFRVM